MDPLKKVMEDLDAIAAEEPINNKELEAAVHAMIHNLKPEDHRQYMIEYFNNCSLCGSDLEFTHVTHFTYLEVAEEGHCPSCSVRMKKENHRLQ